MQIRCRFDPPSCAAACKRVLIADILRHAPEFTAVTNQWVNSYKRLVPGYEIPEPVEANVYEMSPAQRAELGIAELPGSLIEALYITEKSEVIRRALGDHVFQRFIENKKIEWDQFRVHVTQYELERYLPIL